jgi:restriction endonuclease S subunit
MTSVIQKIDSAFSDLSLTKKFNMAAVEQFKSTITRIRDILRGPGMAITGMDSMRHICLYLLARFMTVEKARELGVPEKFAWENLLKVIPTDGGKQKALDYFFHQHDESLVSHFDRLFGTEKFSFDVKNLDKHKEILEIFGGVDMAVVDMEMDILGYVYEQHLKTGSTAARDLGQFFTDRFICHYMTELCKPGFKKSSTPESVCDPSMGTGGFLTAYIKYFKSAYPEKPVDWSIHQQEIYGCDTDTKVAGFSRLNLFMESGGRRFENLLTHDSLYGDLPKTGFDVILANMPFGIKGIVHAECCERVKALKIRGTKSEPLFLQLMMVSLNPGGRCAVVVPDGMLVNSSACHDGTRKYLLDHFELKRVIKMKGKFFMNTGIQPSILFFENTGKPTTAVEFWEVVNDDKGAITETMVVSVPREKFGPDCSLDMRRYLEDEKLTTNPAGFPMVKLGDVCDYSNGKTLSSSDKIENGEYDVMGGGMTYIGKTNKFNRDGETISISKSGASAGFVAYHNKKYWAGDCITLVTNDTTKMTTKYLYYFMKLNSHLTMSKTSGSTIPHCKWDDIKDILITVPPLTIQQEIVSTLDRIYAPGTTELADTLKMTDKAMDLVLANPGGTTLEPIVDTQRLIRKSAQMVADIKAQMVADVKAQMVAIMKASCVSGAEKPISEIVKLKYGFPFKSSDYTTEGLVVVKHNNISDGYVSKSKKQDYIPSSTQTDDYKMVVGDIVISMDFDCGKVGKVVEDGWVLNQRVCLARTNSVTTLRQEYLYWLLRFGGFYEKMQSLHTGTTIKHISGKDIDKATLKVPSLAVQDGALSRLNALQSQLTALENLQKQSEDNARFILESYIPSL